MRKLHCLLVCILLLISEGLLAQTTEISGRITDITGSPIPLASIRIKSSKTAAGTTADVDGAFKLRVPAGATLLISAVGFENQEIKTGSSPVLNIRLNNDS